MRSLRARALSPPALWRTSAALSCAAAIAATTKGWPGLAVVLAVWAIVSLYGSVDHVVEPVLAELVTGDTDPAAAPWAVAGDGGRPPTELSARQRRVVRLLAYGLADYEVAELVEVDERTVAADVEVILAHLGVEDRAAAIDVTEHAGIVAAAGPKDRGARPAA